jgi:hypothetical protein
MAKLIYPTLAAQSELMADFANVWQTADKIVYSVDAARSVDRQTAARAPLRPRFGAPAWTGWGQKPRSTTCATLS